MYACRYVHGSVSQMVSHGPIPAHQTFIFGFWSVSKNIKTCWEMVLIWPLGICLRTGFGLS